MCAPHVRPGAHTRKPPKIRARTLLCYKPRFIALRKTGRAILGRFVSSSQDPHACRLVVLQGFGRLRPARVAGDWSTGDAADRAGVVGQTSVCAVPPPRRRDRDGVQPRRGLDVAPGGAVFVGGRRPAQAWAGHSPRGGWRGRLRGRGAWVEPCRGGGRAGVGVGRVWFQREGRVGPVGAGRSGGGGCRRLAGLGRVWLSHGGCGRGGGPGRCAGAGSMGRQGRVWRVCRCLWGVRLTREAGRAGAGRRLSVGSFSTVWRLWARCRWRSWSLCGGWGVGLAPVKKGGPVVGGWVRRSRRRLWRRGRRAGACRGSRPRGWAWVG